MTFFTRIFPKAFDNNYGGSRAAIWFFVPVVLLRGVIGFNSLFFTREVATGADGIPVDSYAPGAAQSVIALFAHLGYFNILMALFGIVVLIRYRGMIPFYFLVLLALQLGGRAVSLLHPFETSAAHPDTGSEVVLGLLALNVLGFVLSLVDRRPKTLTAEGARA